jgi:hypothetical protein
MVTRLGAACPHNWSRWLSCTRELHLALSPLAWFSFPALPAASQCRGSPSTMTAGIAISNWEDYRDARRSRHSSFSKTGLCAASFFTSPSTSYTRSLV